MSPEEKALRDAYLAELWPTCPEVSREQRARDRESAAIHIAIIAERAQPVDNARDAS